MVSHSLNLAELMVDVPMKSIYKEYLFDLSLLNVRFQEVITKELDNYIKILISIVIN